MRLKIVLSGRSAKLALVCVMVLFTLSSRATDSLLQKARHKFGVIPTQPPALKNNPLTPEKIALGKLLFFDPRLSASGTISCNSCHDLSKGGVDGLDTSIGNGGQKGKRNSPTVFNAVFNSPQFWDGRAPDLTEQAKGPLQAAVEMANTPAHVVETLKAIPAYVARFRAAFPQDQEALTFENVAQAIAAFEATLLTPNSRFDQYLSGDENALTAQEQQGLKLFIAKDCASCHKGVNLGGVSFHRFGVSKKPSDEIRPPQDKGRHEVTHQASDEYVFRAPTLRNVELTAPYFHSGKVADLRQAITVMTMSQLGIKLKDQEIESIVAFLKTLTGVMPNIEAPTLPAR
ncbi:MAG TPA: cytochrome-c peroxidase [Blastocatellia bacterium]|nr:cytochrome-c peroxidase [Blastocatellia bacterium]